MSARVSIGIHVHAEPARLLETLAAVERPGRQRYEVLLFPDGPDAMTRRALAGLQRLRQSPTSRPLGAPACFNRLVSEADADVVILLESGAVPAPGALDRLVVALEREPKAGLAGPSTNSAWNEQNAFPGAAGNRAAIERAGREAARRYRRHAQSLAPLYGPADFCLAVRREVIEAIGGADESFGLGPCWEMEYAARAARAGFDSLWVCGAYVWRAPFTARRRRQEERLFDQSRRRYQDAVCGLRLRGERAGYEPHCRGDACEHFAPAGLIRLRRELPGRTAAPTPPTPTPARTPAVPRQETPPLVSCVMPTRDRADFVLHAVRLFQRQDYPSRELIVVDDGDDRLESRLPEDARIRYLRAVRGESIGAKRNRACAAAQGAFIAQWDDDDWYGPSRLSVQLAPLRTGRADITGLVTPVFFDLPAWRFWGVTPQLHRRMFVADVHGGTLAFARHVWERGRYPDASLAEDAAFLARARARGARLERVDGAGHFVYLRHGHNAWNFALGAHVDRSGWLPVAEPAFPPEDRAFYAARSPAAGGPPPHQPLVSCLMPTRNRRRFVAQAIDYFLRQDYEQRELVVLDDGDDRVADLMPADPRVRYIPLDEKLVLGEKRNRACELAQAEIVVHWDDDDWHAPNRLSYQLGELERHGAALCGTGKVLYFEPTARRGWLYESPKTQRRWIAGLCYRKSLWHENRFAHVQVGEDTRFVCNARIGAPLLLPDHRFFVGVVHAGNTSPKLTTGSNWRARPFAEIGAVLGSDFAFYETL